MNISNLLKTGILACTMIFCINNNVNATNVDNIEEDYNDIDTRSTYHTVNDKVFQHNVLIYNPDDQNTTEYIYRIPQKKIYVKNRDTGCYELQSPNFNERGKEEYQAYADNNDEYNYEKYNCKVEHFGNSDNKMDGNTADKFDELYNRKKIANEMPRDAKTKFAEAVCRVFGNDYKVIENHETEFSKILAQHPGNRIQAKTKNGTQKDLIKIFYPFGNCYTSKEVYELLKQNGFQLKEQIKKYSWYKNGGIVVKNDQGEEKILSITPNMLKTYLDMDNIIITNGCNVIVFNPQDEVINIYERYGCHTELEFSEDLLDKFYKAGLVLQEAYIEELGIVKEVFGQNFELMYR